VHGGPPNDCSDNYIERSVSPIGATVALVEVLLVIAAAVILVALVCGVVLVTRRLGAHAQRLRGEADRLETVLAARGRDADEDS